MLSIDLELQAGSPASVAKKSQSFLCPHIQALTLMLESPPSTLPMFIGMARPFRWELGSARKFQSRSDPRFKNHCPGSFTLGTSSSPPASIRRTLTSGFSASRRATTDPAEPDPQMMTSYCDFISDDSLD